MNQILNNFTEKAAKFLERYGTPANTVTMDHLTFRALSAECPEMLSKEPGTSRIYINGIRILRTSDMEFNVFYFSPQV